jgi:beta-N-acetylhexosaminidase
MSGARPALVGLRGTVLGADERELLEHIRPRGILVFSRNVNTGAQVEALLQDATTCLRDCGVEDPIVAVDHEGGAVCMFTPAVEPGPSAATLGLAADPAWSEWVWYERGAALGRQGVDLLLGPVADVNRPGNRVSATRAFGETPEIVVEQVGAAVRGLHAAGLRCCLKHWPGHGAALADSHLELPALPQSERERRAVDHPPFDAGVRAGADAVMVAHLLPPADWGAPSLPMTVNPVALRRLREELEFSGPIVADALEMSAFSGHEADEALEAGCDLLLLARPIEDCVEPLLELELKPVTAWPARRVEAPSPRSREWPVVQQGDVGGRSWPGNWRLEDLATGDRLLPVPEVRLGTAGEGRESPSWYEGRFPRGDPDRPAALVAVAVRPPLEEEVQRILELEEGTESGVSLFLGSLGIDPRLGPCPDDRVRFSSPELRPENLERVISAIRPRFGSI